MKKLTLSAALVAALFLGLTSCTKNDDVSTTSKSAGTARVIFGSVDEYEQLFASPEQTDSLISKLAAQYGTYQENARIGTNPEDTLYSDFLQKILNEDHIVQIEDWLIKIDKMSQFCLVLETKYESEYNDLVNNNFSNSHLLKFGLEEEVLTLLKSGLKSEVARTEGLFCKGTRSNNKNLYNQHYGEFTDQYDENKMYLDIVTKYEPGAFVFELTSNVRSYYMLPKTSDCAYCSTKFDYTKKVLGLGWDAKWRENCGTLISKDEWSLSYNTHLAIKSHYKGYKSLNRFTIEVRGITNLKDNSLWESPKLLMAGE